MTQVFVSYSRTDKEFVQRLAMDLQQAGLDVWWDLSDIQGSDVWERKIEEGLRTSQYFIVVLSPASLESRWVRREYLSADNKALKIIPLRLKAYDEAPLTLRDIQPIDAVERRYEDVLSDVLRVLKFQETDLVGTADLKGLEENSYSESNRPKASTASTAIAPIGLLDLSGMLLAIIYFILAGFRVLNLIGNSTYFVWLLSAFLTGFYFLFRRQISPGLPIKISLIVFLLSHTVVAYSNLTGSGIDFIPSKVEGLSALTVAGLLFINLRTPKKSAPYSSIMLAVFLILAGAKLLINEFGRYPAWPETFIILSGIIASIILWLDQ